MSPADVAVIGAGVIGCAVARELALRGARVVVVERDEPGAHASWAAAGMLTPQAESERADPFLALLLAARSLIPETVAALREEAGMEVGYRTEGTLLIAFSAEDEVRLAERYEWQAAAGLAVERLSGQELAALEPGVSARARHALRFPGDHQIDNRLLTRALWFAAAAAGAEFRVGMPASRLLYSGGRLRGLALHGGETVEAEHVVLAAGSWTAQLEGLPRALPIEPVHGQLLALEATPPLIKHVVGTPRGYVVPRSDGRVIVGTTVERIGFSRAVTAAGLHRILHIALEIAPGLAERPVAAHWSGLRPGTPDALPILGPDPAAPNLLYATGHFRNGILLAPLTGRLIAELAGGRNPEIDLAPFSVSRFE